MVDDSSHGGGAENASALLQLRRQVTSHADAIRLACVWEATAAKVGNVHPTAAFADCGYVDFCRAAEEVAPLLAGPDNKRPGDGRHDNDERLGSDERPGNDERPGSDEQRAALAGGANAGSPSLGDRVLAAITATRAVTTANVNLGIVLLIAPLAMARDRADVRRVLAALTSADGAKVYRAIAIAGAGGLDSDPVDPRWDVATAAPEAIDLIAAMRLARDRDRIARQYAEDFADFFDNVLPVVEAELAATDELGEAIVRAQLRLLAAEPDSLILRKCGAGIADEVCRRAAACWAAADAAHRAQRESLDRWLREDGNRRNPGTTADLIAAALYWLIR